jgi:lipopolysaccharide transport system ATP-binding protein
MDEVLAVGDVSFQQKCFDKMNEIRNQGRTILFVSHSMAGVTRLCERAILLDKGQMIADGPANEVVNGYLGSSWKVTSEREWVGLDQAPGNEIVRLLKVRARTEQGATVDSVSIQEPIGIELTYEVLQPGCVLTPTVDVVNEGGIHLFTSHDVEAKWRRQPRPPGRYVSTMWIPGNFLSGGNLVVNATIMSHYPATATHVHEPRVITFQVVDNGELDSARGDYVGPLHGVIRPLLNWTTDHSYLEEGQLEEAATL